MTVSAATRRVQFTVGSSGQAGPYAFSFKVLNQDDLAVYVGSTTASTLKTISTHYTVSLAAAGTGTITFVSGQEPTEAQLVTIIGDRAIARTTDFTAGGDIRASTLNDDGDAQTILIQQLEEKIDRSIQIQTFGNRNFASGGDGPLFWPYDTTSNNASKLVAFTSGGNALELVDKNASALGGSNTHVQFNSGGTALGGSANLTFDGTNLSSAGIDLNGNLDVATQATDIVIIDNNAAALEIKEAGNAYLTFVTTNSGEKIVADKSIEANAGIDLDGNLDASTQATNVSIIDNTAAALDIKEGSTSYLKFVTTNSGEKITLGKKLEAGSVEIEGSAFDIDGGDISAATISGSLTWSAAQNLNSQALTNVDINSGSVDGATIGAASPSTIVGTTITANTSLLPDAVGGADIGSTSAEWGDVFIADDKAIKLGNDQDFTIEYDEDGLDTTRVVAAGGVTMSPHGTSSGNTTELRFLELAANGNNYAGFKAPDSITGTSVYTLPAAFPASNKILQSTDAGVLTWETAASGGASLSNDANNRVTTADGSGGLNGEANLTFDGDILNVATKLGVTTSHDLGTGVHIRSADSSASVSGDADELVIEGSGNAGLSILTGTSALGSIYFGDSGDNDIGGFYYDHSGNALNIRSNGSDRMRLDSSGALNFGDDLQNGSLTIGININQGSNDNEIIALKSTDIAHGLTSVAETDTYGSLKKNDGGIRGGLAIYGMAESDYTGAGVELHAYSQGVDSASSTSATAVVSVRASKTSGTGGAALSSNANAFQIVASGNTQWICDAEGDTKYNGSDGAGAFDDYDDVELLTAKRIVTHTDRAWAQKTFGKFVSEHAQILHDAGIITMNDDGAHFVSTKGLNALMIDAIRQTRAIQKAFYAALPKSQRDRFAAEIEAMALPVLPAFQQGVE